MEDEELSKLSEKRGLAGWREPPSFFHSRPQGNASKTRAKDRPQPLLQRVHSAAGSGTTRQRSTRSSNGQGGNAFIPSPVA